MDLNKSIICPKCGSKNIFVSKRGFSTGKAIAGGLLTGNIFVMAASGGIGANKIKLTCLDCGHTFNIGEGGKELPSKEELAEFEKHVIPVSEMPKTAMFKCDCGKVFCGESNYPICPKCGRRMNKENLASEIDLGYNKNKTGCLGIMILPLIFILCSIVFFVI